MSRLPFDASAPTITPAAGDFLPVIDVSDGNIIGKATFDTIIEAAAALTDQTITTLSTTTIQGISDTDTTIAFGTDSIVGSAGGVEFYRMVESTQDALTFNNGAADVDFTVNAVTSGTVIDYDAGAATLTLGNSSIPVTTTNIDAGTSGTAGSVDVFPTTASMGKLSITAADSAGDTTTTLVNASQGGARTYTIPDLGASGNFVLATAFSQLIDGVAMSTTKWVDVTVDAASLDSAGTVNVIAGVAGDQYKIRDVILVGGGTNYAAGGDRDISLTDGTTVWTTIANADIETAPATSLRWGDTKVPFLTGTSDTASASAAAIRFQYSGGTTDHSATGSINFAVCLEKVA